jgi:hypothetical protein
MGLAWPSQKETALRGGAQGPPTVGFTPGYRGDYKGLKSDRAVRSRQGYHLRDTSGREASDRTRASATMLDRMRDLTGRLRKFVEQYGGPEPRPVLL